jgi:hypothetical protein
VEGIPEDIGTIVVHGEEGYLRSCAIALALSQIYGFEEDQESQKEARPSVLKVPFYISNWKQRLKKGRN